MVVFFFATLFYKTGSGPLWRIMIEPEVLDCQKNWWVSILYLGNYVNVENMVRKDFLIWVVWVLKLDAPRSFLRICVAFWRISSFLPID